MVTPRSPCSTASAYSALRSRLACWSPANCSSAISTASGNYEDTDHEVVGVHVPATGPAQVTHLRIEVESHHLGKVIVILYGGMPPGVPGNLAAHYSTPEQLSKAYGRAVELEPPVDLEEVDVRGEADRHLGGSGDQRGVACLCGAVDHEGQGLLAL